MENAVVYARFSSHNQTENSIEAQVSAAQDFATKNNLNIIKVYADRAKTGTNDNREEFQQMLKDSSTHAFSVVIVWKVDRFGRNREEITMNKYRLKKNGVRLEYVAENISSSPEGVILESVLEGFAEYYSKQLSQNVKRGLHERRVNGFVAGGVTPMGYRLIDGKYIVDNTEAKKIKEVFKMYVSGETQTNISIVTGIPKGSLTRIINNKTYIGIHEIAGDIVKVPKIIDEHVFELAKRRYNSRTRMPKEKGNYILTGKLYCKCGAKYAGTITCKNRGKMSAYRSYCFCGYRYIEKSSIEKEIIQNITSIISSEDIINRIYEKLKMRSKEDKLDVNYLNSLTRKRDNIYKAIEDGLSFDSIKDRLNEIEKEIGSVNINKPKELSKDDIRIRISHIKALESNKALIENIIDKIIVDPKTGLYEIQYKV